MAQELDKRTVHLLPAANSNRNPPSDWHSQSSDPLKISRELEARRDSERAARHGSHGGAHSSNFIGPSRPMQQATQSAFKYAPYVPKPYLKRYGAILEKHGVRCVAKIITTKDLDDWALENGYTVIRGGRMTGWVSEKYERTEFAEC